MTSEYIWSTVIPSWLTAVGTVLAVLWALFQGQVRRWYNKPKIKVTSKADKPYVEERAQESTSSSNDMELSIRVGIENTGRWNAKCPAVYVDSYYYKSGDDKYVENTLLPIQLQTINRTMPQNIVPSLLYYFELASIHKQDNKTAAGGDGEVKQNYKLYLLVGPGKQKQLGKGCFVIPVKFYASQINPVITYVKVLWNSDDFTKDKGKFCVEEIAEKEFKKLIR